MQYTAPSGPERTVYAAGRRRGGTASAPAQINAVPVVQKADAGETWAAWQNEKAAALSPAAFSFIIRHLPPRMIDRSDIRHSARCLIIKDLHGPTQPEPMIAWRGWRACLVFVNRAHFVWGTLQSMHQKDIAPCLRASPSRGTTWSTWTPSGQPRTTSGAGPKQLLLDCASHIDSPTRLRLLRMGGAPPGPSPALYRQSTRWLRANVGAVTLEARRNSRSAHASQGFFQQQRRSRNPGLSRMNNPSRSTHGAQRGPRPTVDAWWPISAALRGRAAV